MSEQLEFPMDTSGRELSPGERGEPLTPDIYPGCPWACACGATGGHWSRWYHTAPSPWAPSAELLGAWPYNPHGS